MIFPLPRRTRHVRHAVLGLATSVALLLPAAARAETFPPGFVAEPVLQKPHLVLRPTQLAFFPDGRMLIATKGGIAWVASGGVVDPDPVWDGLAEVDGELDRGFLGVAVDPDFASNRYVYFLYTVDPDSIEGNAPQRITFCRLTRYQMSLADPNRVDPATRTVLIGRTWREGALNAWQSHSVGSLRWGRDKSLLVSFGDGAAWNGVDYGRAIDSLAFQPGRTDTTENIGAYRAQFLGSLCGKILRINPHTGHGYASNPYADGNLASVRSRVYQYGIRNAYRFVVKPGTGNPDTSVGDPGVLYLGDTGWNTWEDVCVADQPGLNFGWPCYEGPNPNLLYVNAPAHWQPKHHGCSTIGAPENPGALRGVLLTWGHTAAESAQAIPPGGRGTIGIGGEFHDGYTYPLAYRGRYYYGDFGANWISMATVNAAHQLQSAVPFCTEAQTPIGLERDPATGELFLIGYFGGPHDWGEIRRIRWTGTIGNAPPVAAIDGPAPFYVTGHAVNLSGSGSDTEDAPAALVHEWKVDRAADGAIAFDAEASLGTGTSFVPAAGNAAYEAHHVVYDSDGKSDTARVAIHPEVDLSPSAVTVGPGGIGTGIPTEMRFWIRNTGRMTPVASHWTMIVDQTMFAEGDTVVPARDSVEIVRTIDAVLPNGTHVLRVTADSLAALTETSETNNAWFMGFAVKNVGVGDPPRILSVSEAFPNPGVGGTAFTVTTPRATRIDWRVFDVHGREVWRQRRALEPGAWPLEWNGIDGRGKRVRPGLFFARLSVGGRSFDRRFTLVR